MNKILAIVVTYNRLNDLKHCIESLERQSYNMFDVLVVNNGSIDGTSEWLRNFCLNIYGKEKTMGVKVIEQYNLGGAGGFYAGQKYAVENGYDWIWMMDDDGVPHHDQLKNLVTYTNKTGKKFVNALVIDKDNHSRFAFHAYDWTIEKAKKVEIIDKFIHPFNGTFIHTDILKECGLTKKEMFIWGDEVELTMRYTKAGYKPVTVANAIHYHPKEKGVSDIVLPGIINRSILVKPIKMSKYYYRNLGYIHGVYYHDKWYNGWKPMICYLLYYCRKMNFSEAYKAVKYYIRGMQNNYNG